MRKPPLITRRQFLKKGAAWFATFLATCGGTILYSEQIERYWYRIDRVEHHFVHLPKDFHGLKIVQFSDVHLGKSFGYKHFERICRDISDMKPDIICFTGDLFDRRVTLPVQGCIDLLNGLQAPFGKWAVLGNHDYRAGAVAIRDVLTQSGFIVLKNEHHIVLKNQATIRIAGVDNVLLGKPDVNRALSKEGAIHVESIVRLSDGDLFTLLLAHEPDYADTVSGFEVDLQLSGHTHGGQVRLPIIGALSRPKYGERYTAGFYSVGDRLTLYVNRGIGTTVLPIRLFCRPEITEFTLYAKA